MEHPNYAIKKSLLTSLPPPFHGEVNIFLHSIYRKDETQAENVILDSKQSPLIFHVVGSSWVYFDDC